MILYNQIKLWWQPFWKRPVITLNVTVHVKGICYTIDGYMHIFRNMHQLVIISFNQFNSSYVHVKLNWNEFILFIQHITYHKYVHNNYRVCHLQTLTWTRSTEKKALKRVHLISILDFMAKMFGRQRPCPAHLIHT